MILACFLLLAASRVELVDEVYQIPANEWRYVTLPLNQQPGRVTARYEVTSGSRSVRLLLLQSDDVERLRAGLPHESIEMTAASGEGALTYQVRIPSEYPLVIENRGSSPATVSIHVWLKVPAVTQLSPRRQLSVIVISFAVFFGIVSFSARRLLRVVRR